MPGYGARYWAERTPAGRRGHHSAFRGDASADVVVIGGGLTGATAAYVLAKGGLDVILVEGDRIASAGTAAGLGTLMPEPAASYRAVEGAVGTRQAKAAWRAARSGALEMAAALRRLNIRCDLDQAPLVTAASRADASPALRKEHALRKRADLDAAWLTPRAAAAAIGSETEGAIKQKDGFVFDPVRATLGMVKAAEAAGARIFEKSAARRTTFTRKSADVVMENGRIRTRAVFVATGAPGSLFRPLVRHVRQFDAYAVVTEPLTSAMKRDTGRRDHLVAEVHDSTRFLRWLDDGRAMFAGAAGPPVSARNAQKDLIQKTGQLMYELSLRHPIISGLPARWSWRVRLVSTLDGLPWIGAHRNYPFHFFSIAHGWHGDALAWFGARAALRQIRGEPIRGDDIFEFGR